ncbi:MAG: succinylglutamate desuccinylase/aspartoacylase family protein [Kiritimatiellae bacterium]|nr:succinylglutamate desuccinylase/aspartoacylase family protein [Kiritimatiellia bacterium]
MGSRARPAAVGASAPPPPTLIRMAPLRHARPNIGKCPTYRFQPLDRQKHARAVVLLALLLRLFSAVADDGPAGVLLDATDTATPWYETHGNAPGPIVVLVGGTHGDEIAGAIAADQIRRWPLCRGRLRVLPRANVRAIAAGRRTAPDQPSATANLNRNFPTGRLPEPRGELAAAIWRWLSAEPPDWVLDLHEGSGVHATNRGTVGSSLIVPPDANVRAIATQLWRRVNTTVTDPSLQFTILATGGVTGGLMRAAWERLGARAITLETTMAYPLALRVRQHRLMVHELLRRLEMIGEEVRPEVPLAPRGPRPPQGCELRVAVYADAGAEPAAVRGLLAELEAPGRVVMPVGAAEIADSALAAFDVLVVPDEPTTRAGALRTEFDARVAERIRHFVRSGGGYVGLGAGADAGRELGFVRAPPASPTGAVSIRSGGGRVALFRVLPSSQTASLIAAIEWAGGAANASAPAPGH